MYDTELRFFFSSATEFEVAYYSFWCLDVHVRKFTEDMGYRSNIVPGELPGYGAIFMSNSGTKKECFQRKLFGLPLAQSDFVLHVKKGMFLFLFEFEKRQLHGVFRATSNGEIDIEPHAFRSSQKSFPAQVPFTSVWNCYPLYEHEFKDAIRDNYFSWKKFKFGLSKHQVDELLRLFHSKRISKNNPPRTCLRYDDNSGKRDSRYGDNRKKVRERMKFIEEKNGHGFEIDEVKEIDNQGYKTLMKKRAHKDNKEVLLTNRMKEIDDFGDCGYRKLDKRLDHTLRGLRRVSDESLHFQCDINNGNKNFLVDCIAYKKKYRDYSRVQDEYHVIDDFSENHSALDNLGNSPNKGTQKIVDGWFFPTVESQQRRLTNHPKGVTLTTDVCQNPNYEPRTPSFEPRKEDFGIKLCSDEEFDLKNANQNLSDFIPVSEASKHFQNRFEANNIENSYERKFLNLTSCDPSIYPSETIPPHFRKPRSKKYVRKASVFDHLNSAPKPLIHKQEHESDEKSELDASTMLEKVVREEKESTFEQDDKNVDYEALKKESDVKVECEGIDIVEETRVVDFKRRKRTNKKNLDDEFKENNTSGTDSDVGMCCKRRRLVRPVFVKKELNVSNDENVPLKDDSSLRKACESVKKIEGQKHNIESCLQVEQNGNAIDSEKQEEIWGFDDMAWVVSSKYEHKMCGWIDE
ncbi:unnamed protein product [Lactuca saligna]|uniref:DCD domain-containing protein n=1 Tax=Lactuca saligna TaxID=75948 RepID=A0AA35W123_LACSI|nr:unnamed protein product [Lactuca saligna]